MRRRPPPASMSAWSSSPSWTRHHSLPVNAPSGLRCGSGPAVVRGSYELLTIARVGVRIAFAAAEAAPFAKVGGLADVAGSLPQALARVGADVVLYVPLHGTIDRAKWGIPASGPERSVAYGASHARVAYPFIEREGVRIVFVDSKRIGRDKVYGAPDDAKRYAFFCRAVATALGDEPTDVVHAHDWHAALLVPMVAKKAATVFTIHNLAYQGKTSADVLEPVGLSKTRLPVERPGE